MVHPWGVPWAQDLHLSSNGYTLGIRPSRPFLRPKKMATTLTSWPKNIISFIKESRDELKKVSWPSRQTTLRYTVIVVAASLAVGLITGGVDYFLTIALEKLVI